MSAMGWFIVVLGAIALWAGWRIVRAGDDDK
jgi:hypothetical protein